MNVDMDTFDVITVPASTTMFIDIEVLPVQIYRSFEKIKNFRYIVKALMFLSFCSSHRIYFGPSHFVYEAKIKSIGIILNVKMVVTEKKGLNIYTTQGWAEIT